MEENKKIKLERRRNIPFTVNCPVTKKKYFWSGAKRGKTATVEVSQETYDWLVMDTTTMVDAELVIVEEDVKEEFNQGLDNEDKEAVANNSHTREEIVKILEGHAATMKSELGKITKDSEKMFVVQTAVEMKVDSAAKRKFLNEWSGAEIDFKDDEE